MDDQGRPTQATGPAGTVDYWVYNDVGHGIRAYPGWDGAAGRPTGPTVVAREDRAGGYTEALTRTAAPHLAGGRPDGVEAIGGVQTLTRASTNTAQQVVRQDVYVNLAGLTYTTAELRRVELPGPGPGQRQGAARPSACTPCRTRTGT